MKPVGFSMKQGAAGSMHTGGYLPPVSTGALYENGSFQYFLQI